MSRGWGPEFEQARVPGGFRCPECGTVERSEFLLSTNHGFPGMTSQRLQCWLTMLVPNQAAYAFRTGDLAGWKRATGLLRPAARFRRARRLRVMAEWARERGAAS